MIPPVFTSDELVILESYTFRGRSTSDGQGNSVVEAWVEGMNLSATGPDLDSALIDLKRQVICKVKSQEA